MGFRVLIVVVAVTPPLDETEALTTTLSALVLGFDVLLAHADRLITGD